MTWHDNASACTLVNERGEILAVIVREARGGEKCRLYVKEAAKMLATEQRPWSWPVGTFASVAAAKDYATTRWNNESAPEKFYTVGKEVAA